MNSKDKCIAIDHPNVMPGWGCCQCHLYNGEQRTECKGCKHPRCDKLEIITAEDAKYLKGEPVPLTILIPVEIEED